MVVGKLLSYWEGNFSGAMLNFQSVLCSSILWAEVIISIVTLKMDDRNWYVKMALQFWATRNFGVFMSWQQHVSHNSMGTPSGVATWGTFSSGHRIQWCSWECLWGGGSVGGFMLHLLDSHLWNTNQENPSQKLSPNPTRYFWILARVSRGQAREFSGAGVWGDGYRFWSRRVHTCGVSLSVEFSSGGSEGSVSWKHMHAACGCLL